MSTTYTLTKVEPYLGAGDQTSHSNEILSGSGDSVQGKQYRYTGWTNDTPAKKIIIISPDANLLTPGSDYKSGTNTGTIVITDTPG